MADSTSLFYLIISGAFEKEQVMCKFHNLWQKGQLFRLELICETGLGQPVNIQNKATRTVDSCKEKMFLSSYRKLWGEWHGGFQRAGLSGRPVHRSLRQNLQQCRGEALWPPPEETTRTPSQSPRGGLLLRRHDGPRPPDGHEEAGGVRGVPPHWQVCLCFYITLAYNRVTLMKRLLLSRGALMSPRQPRRIRPHASGAE